MPRPTSKPTGRPAPAGARGKFRRGGPPKRKVCRFCADKLDIDYKNVNMLRTFITEKGKMLGGRVTGTCSKHQRTLATAIRRARILALVPYSTAG